MGNCAKSEVENQFTIKIDGFKKIHPIGKGAFGKVWKVVNETTGDVYAMKEMSKSLVYSKKLVASVMNERKFLGMLKHPFLVNLHYAFQDRENLYLVVDMMPGGDLRYYYMMNATISEDSLKFMTACIVAGLEYLFVNNIIHRDLKPENLVFDVNGYLHLTDFGIARTGNMDNTNTSSGTPGYMSPEAICMQNQSTVSDYFSLGVILFEATNSTRPYLGSNKKEIRNSILQKQVKMPANGKWSKELRHFIDRLIQRKAQKRLGFNGIEEIKNHPWLEDIEWEKLLSKSLKSPFKISPGNNFDHKQVSENFSASRVINESLNSKLFSGYSFSSF